MPSTPKPNDTLSLYRIHRARVNARKQADLQKAVLAVKLAEVAPTTTEPTTLEPTAPEPTTARAGGKKGSEKPE
jgi:hypothetical protein